VGAGRVVAVPLSDPREPFVVAKVIVEGLENPPGERARPVGRRAVRAMMAPP
jgi:ribosomal protein S12 methylthiotransferase accessory factor